MSRESFVTIVVMCISLVGPIRSGWAQQEVQQLQQSILDLQLPNGAFRVHPDPGAYGPDGAAWYAVQPYFVNCALRNLLITSDTAKLPGGGSAKQRALEASVEKAVERWIDWYMAHRMKGVSGRKGVVCVHWYQRDCSGETTRHPGGNRKLDDHSDADDSVCATILDLGAVFLNCGGNQAVITRHKNGLREVADTIHELTDSIDGLTWAKENYRVKYLMDN